MSVSAQSLLMRANSRSPNPLHVIQGCGKADRLDDWWSASFEPMGRMIVRHGLPRDLLDHLPAAQKWRHRLKHLPLAIQNTDACRAVELVARKHVEIRPEIPNVHIEVDGAL